MVVHKQEDNFEEELEEELGEELGEEERDQRGQDDEDAGFIA